MSLFSLPKVFLVLALSLGLAACDSAEEKAEAFYQSGKELLEQGDPDRAAVEFRNVLQLNAQHREARIALAEIQRANGNVRGAYSQYLRVAEQYSDDAGTRIALAEMAIEAGNWEEARRHGARAIELAPGNPAVDVIELNLAYLVAFEDEDAPARRAAASRAATLLEDDTENLLLRQILMYDAIREGAYEQAMEELDAIQAIDPDRRSFYDTRLGLLAQLERQDEIEGLLREMLEKFPEDEELPGVLLRFYVATDDTENAQTFLRETADAAEDDDTRRAALTTLVRLVLETGGREAAVAELDDLIETQEDPTVYRMLRAGMVFDSGQRAEAISEMEALLEAETTPDETTSIKVGLAQMLIETGDTVGARARVEEVLETNATQPDALKIKAGWLIESDETQEALSLLRLALDQDSNDATALTLTARAYDRSGDRNLTREFLTLAVEASGGGAPETLRYADLMIEEERYLPAEEALLAALRRSEGNQQILQRLGMLYLQTEDWGRAQQVEDALNELDDPAASQLATGLQAARLASQGQMEDALAFLEEYAAGEGQGELNAQIAVIQTRLASGDQDGALAFAEELAAEAPEDLSRRFALASVQSALGRYEESIASYRQIIDQEPLVQQAWVNMIRVMYASGDIEAAEATLQEGLSVLPEGLDLLWAQAGFSEERGDIDTAIELYERIYERASNQLIAANNLASLLSTYRSDEEASLERAYTISRRLRGTDVAPFQDTYGWIAYQREDFDEALEYLEPAAAGLPDDPIVQFHLAMTYAGLGRDQDALPVFQRALEIAGPDDTRSQFDTARTEVARIEATQ